MIIEDSKTVEETHAGLSILVPEIKSKISRIGICAKEARLCTESIHFVAKHMVYPTGLLTVGEIDLMIDGRPSRLAGVIMVFRNERSRLLWG